MENIFEGAKFGDKFRRRDGGFAIYLSTKYSGNEENKNNPPFIIIHMANELHLKYKDGSEKRLYSVDTYSESGKWNRFSEEDDDWDIVDKWEKSVDEEKLEMLAIDECDKLLNNEIFYYNGIECVVLSDAEKCYIAGYHKAKEN